MHVECVYGWVGVGGGGMCVYKRDKVWFIDLTIVFRQIVLSCLIRSLSVIIS